MCCPLGLAKDRLAAIVNVGSKCALCQEFYHRRCAISNLRERVMVVGLMLCERIQSSHC